MWRQKVAVLLRAAEVGAAEVGGVEPGAAEVGGLEPGAAVVGGVEPGAAGGRRGTEAVPGGQGVGTVRVGSHHTGPAL